MLANSRIPVGNLRAVPAGRGRRLVRVRFVTPRGAPLPLSSTAVNQIVQISFPLTSAFSISENPESSEWRFEVFT